MDVRYRGQGYELNVPYTRSLMEAFQGEHQRRYGYNYPAREVELVTLRLRATMKSPQACPSHVGTDVPVRPGRAQPGSSNPEHGPVLFGDKTLTAQIYDRDSLQIGKRYSGPAVVTEYSATTVVPPGMRLWVDKPGNLVIATK